MAARPIGQVRDMLALASQGGPAPEYFPSVPEAVDALLPSAARLEEN